MQFPISIDLRRSVLFSLFIVVSHFVALGAMCAMPWAWQLRSFLALLIVYAAWRATRPPRVVGLRILGGDRLAGVSGDGAHHPLSICEKSTVYPQAIILRVRLGDERKVTSLVLFPDQMSEGQFHKLRLWLRGQTAPKNLTGSVVS